MNIMSYAARDIITIVPTDAIDFATSLMEERGIHHLVVVTSDVPVGVVSDRDILLSTGWMTGSEREADGSGNGRTTTVGPARVAQIMSRHLVSLTSKSTAQEAAQLMVDWKIGALPVTDNGHLIGLITETELLRWLGDLAFGANAAAALLEKPVTALMTSRLVSIGPRVSLEEIVELFRRYRIRHLPVTEPGGAPIGIVSDRDLRRALGWRAIHADETPTERKHGETGQPRSAEDIMQASVRSVSPETTLRETLHEMLETRIHSLLVIERDKLIGIVTMTDFTRAIARESLL